VPLSGSSARRYAEAIYDLAKDDGAIDAHRSSLERLAEGLDADARRALRDPSVPMERRLAAIDAAAAGEPAAIRSVLRLLAERDRIELLPAIARAFGELVDRRAGIARGKVTTAVALDDAQRQAFVDRLERASGKKIRATFSVDPELIGGASVQVGDHLVDASVRAQLNALRARLAS